MLFFCWAEVLSYKSSAWAIAVVAAFILEILLYWHIDNLDNIFRIEDECSGCGGRSGWAEQVRGVFQKTKFVGLQVVLKRWRDVNHRKQFMKAGENNGHTELIEGKNVYKVSKIN